MTTHVHLYGSFLLDNQFWFVDEGEEGKSVAKQLESKLGDGYELHNHAYLGQVDGEVKSPAKMRENAAYTKYAVLRDLRQDKTFKPFDKLASAIQLNKDAAHYVVYQVTESVEKTAAKIDALRQANDNVFPILVLPPIPTVGSTTYNKINFRYKAALVVTVAGIVFAGVGLAILALKVVSLGERLFLTVVGAAITVALVAGGPLPEWAVHAWNGRDLTISKLIEWRMELYRSYLALGKQKNVSVIDLPNSINPLEPRLVNERCVFTEQGSAWFAQAITTHIQNLKRDPDTFRSSVVVIDANGHLISDMTNPWTVHYPAKTAVPVHAS